MNHVRNIRRFYHIDHGEEMKTDLVRGDTYLRRIMNKVVNKTTLHEKSNN